MGVIDYKRVESYPQSKKECIDFCVQFSKELPQALKKANTPVETRDAKYAYGSAVVNRTAVKSGGLFSPKIASFYCIISDSTSIWPDALTATDHGATISTGGRYFFNFSEMDAEGFGNLIAEVCEFDKKLAERVLYDAISGNYWTIDDIIKAVDKSKQSGH